MTVKLLAEQHFEFLCLKGDCTGMSESTHVKMPHCWKSHVAAHIVCIIDVYKKYKYTLAAKCCKHDARRKTHLYSLV